MSSSTKIDDAISALRSAYAAIDRKEDPLRASLQSEFEERNAFLRQEVEERFLPAISAAALATLERELPAFVTPVVRQAFQANRKLLGLFKGPGYAHALTLLRTQLKSHLVRVRFGRLQVYDGNIEKTEQELSAISLKKQEVHELISLLQDAILRKVPLPAAVMRDVGRIVYRAGKRKAAGGALRAGRFGGASLRSSDDDVSAAQDDDSDLWIYLLADTPTSFRTLLWSALSSHHGAADDGTSGSWSAGVRSDRSDRCDEHGDGAALDASHGHGHSTSGSRGDFDCGVAVVIATDDSLGRFS